MSTIKVTITIETDDEMTKVTRDDVEMRIALAGCLLVVDDRYPFDDLARIADAARRELGRAKS